MYLRKRNVSTAKKAFIITWNVHLRMYGPQSRRLSTINWPLFTDVQIIFKSIESVLVFQVCIWNSTSSWLTCNRSVRLKFLFGRGGVHRQQQWWRTNHAKRAKMRTGFLFTSTYRCKTLKSCSCVLIWPMLWTAPWYHWYNPLLQDFFEG